MLQDLNQRMQRVVEHAAAMHGLAATIEFAEPVPTVTNTPEWLDRMLPSLERVSAENGLYMLPGPDMGNLFGTQGTRPWASISRDCFGARGSVWRPAIPTDPSDRSVRATARYSLGRKRAHAGTSIHG